VIGSGMGTPMIDFAVREAKFVVDGPMAICRFGSACSMSKQCKIGNVVLASKGGFIVQTDFDKLHDADNDELPYKISDLAKPDDTLIKHMDLHLRNSTEEGNYKQGLLATSDSFYNT